MRRSVRKALERMTEEKAKEAADRAAKHVMSQCLDMVRNEIAIAQAFGRADAVAALRTVEVLLLMEDV